MITREEMIKELRTNICTVIFIKADGSERHMECTLMPAFIPEYKEDYKVSSVINLDVIKVYDLESQGWRSFRVDRIKEFNTNEVVL
jgi:hypothetical protein